MLGNILAYFINKCISKHIFPFLENNREWSQIFGLWGILKKKINIKQSS